MAVKKYQVCKKTLRQQGRYRRPFYIPQKVFITDDGMSYETDNEAQAQDTAKRMSDFHNQTFVVKTVFQI